jgi:hypothetical protein
MWWVPVNGETSNSRVFVYYYTTDDWTIFEGSFAECDCIVPTTSAGGEGVQVYGGRQNGEVVQLATGVVDGQSEGSDVGIDGYYITKWYTWPELGYKARPLWVDVVTGDDGIGEAVIEIAYDFSDTWTATGEPSSIFGTQPCLWDYGLWDTMLWDAVGKSLIRYGLEGVGNLFRFRISDDGTLSFQVHLMNVELAAKGKR